MGRSNRHLIFATMLLMLLTGCSHRTVGHSVHMDKFVAQKKESPQAQKKEPAPAHHPQSAQPKTIEQFRAMAKQDADAIPVLLAESDALLKQAHVLQAQAQATKDQKVQHSIASYAKKAQELADKKAQDLLVRKQDMDLRLATIGQMQSGESPHATDKHADDASKGRNHHRLKRHQDDSSDDR
jgi:hypothetical protein